MWHRGAGVSEHISFTPLARPLKAATPCVQQGLPAQRPSQAGPSPRQRLSGVAAPGVQAGSRGTASGHSWARPQPGGEEEGRGLVTPLGTSWMPPPPAARARARPGSWGRGPGGRLRRPGAPGGQGLAGKRGGSCPALPAEDWSGRARDPRAGTAAAPGLAGTGRDGTGRPGCRGAGTCVGAGRGSAGDDSGDAPVAPGRSCGLDGPRAPAAAPAPRGRAPGTLPPHSEARRRRPGGCTALGDSQASFPSPRRRDPAGFD